MTSTPRSSRTPRSSGTSRSPGTPRSSSEGLPTSAFTDFADQHRSGIEEALDRILPGDDVEPTRIHRAMRHSVFAGGKRIRPLLSLLAAECCSAGGAERILGPAAALELIHTFSLVHDDLPALDDDDLRRGRPTVHRAFDEATAVLAGDALLNLALETLAQEPSDSPADDRLRAVVLATRAVGTYGMIGGQVDDLGAERNWPRDAEAMLEAIHRRKTGALLTVSLRLGGLYAGAGPELDSELCELGEIVGLMFQVADDILDIEGTESSLGKTVGKDEEALKLTYPGLYGLEESKAMLGRLEERGIELAARLPRRNDAVVSLIDYLAHRDR